MASDTIHAQSAIDIVEAAYRLDGTEAEWLDAVLAKARPDIDTGSGAYAFTGHETVPNFPASPVFVQHDLDPSFAERLLELNKTAPRAVHDFLRTRLSTCGGLQQFFGADSPIVTHFQELMAPTEIRDGFSLFAQDAEGGSITIAAPSRELLAPAPRVRGLWQRVGLHVASALRLRRRLARERAIRDGLFDPSGKLHDASELLADGQSLAGREAARDVLVRGVRAMEAARRADVRASPERALELWQGLVAGEWSLVEHWESDGRRYIAAYRNRPSIRDPRALTTTERSVLTYLLLGASNKDICYVLGLPAGTVSAAVTGVLRKLQVKRRVDLSALADASRMDRLDVDGDLGVLVVDARPSGVAADVLSAAELEVATYALRGWSNERIAQERRGSPRTVANQLRAIYAKLGIDNRSQLAGALQKLGEPPQPIVE